MGKNTVIAAAAPYAASLTGRSAMETKPVILVVSFGTSYNESREKTIGAVEKAIASACPAYEVRRAFTSQVILDILRQREKLIIDNVEQALERLIRDGVETLVVQPTHVMSGFEYDDMMAVMKRYQNRFQFLGIGAPLLASNSDYDKLITALMDETADWDQSDTAVIFMGHGTEHKANYVYSELQNKFIAAGADNYFIGTVEAKPSLEDMIAAVKAGGYARVVLEPLMVVAGDHANHDMAGDGKDSWKAALEQEGFQVETIVKGLGEIKAVQQIYVEHVKKAIDAMKH